MPLPRIAISQASIIPGGRLQVILEIVHLLNQVGIEPDILTGFLGISLDMIQQGYRQPLRARFRHVSLVPKRPQDTSIVVFNARLNGFAPAYDLLINSSNSLIFLPGQPPVISYMHFPRKWRLMDDHASLHEPEKHLTAWSPRQIERVILRYVYKLSQPRAQHLVVCNSAFTRDALIECYGLQASLPVIYPPVELAKFRGQVSKPGQRVPAVISLGRFVPAKRQLAQIKIAQQLPGTPFHIVGFATNQAYYEECRRYVADNGLDNVHLHPSVSFEDMLDLLTSCQFFLHAVINEPFGITTVQAIAAGCIPITHDSGGQREIVPDPRLRYANLSQVPNILAELSSWDDARLSALSSDLQNHIMEHFDVAVFRQEMAKTLAPHIEAL